MSGNLHDPPAREEIPRRAGTHLDHRFTKPVMATARNGTRQHGVIDTRNEIYQCGGESRNFIYANKNWVSMAESIWRTLLPPETGIPVVKAMEFIDHGENICYRISMREAIKNVHYYTAGIGLRVGFPVERFIVYDADGVPILRVPPVPEAP